MSNETPPHAEGPEKSLLSSMLQTPDVFVQRAKAEGLTPSMFYLTSHASLYREFLEWSDAGKTIELVALADHLLNTGAMDAIGGPAVLSEIYTFAPSSAHFASHLEIVRDCFARREAIQKAEQIKRAAFEGETSQDALTALAEGVDAVRQASAQKKASKDAKQAYEHFIAVMAARKDAGDMPGASTGIHQLNAIGGGMRDGEFWVICGETSAGKSALSYQISLPSIDDGKNVLIFTLEMGTEEVFARLISCRDRIELRSIMSPKGISEEEEEAIQSSAAKLSHSKLQIYDEPNMSIDYICAQCEVFAELNNISLVIVDYIQLLEGGRRQGESREQELARSSRSLKQLAKKLKCPVISPAQLNDDGKLRESRAIGQDADVVLKITDKGIAVNKFRNAQRNNLLPLTLVGKHQRFETSY